MVKEPLTVDALHRTVEFLLLTNYQRTMVDAFIENGHDKYAAYQSLHPTVTKRHSVASSANKLFALPAVRAALDVYFQKDALDTAKAEIRRAMLDRRLTPSQASMVKLFAASYGISIGEPLELPKPPEPEGKVVADRVVERDGRRLRQVVTDLGPTEK